MRVAVVIPTYNDYDDLCRIFDQYVDIVKHEVVFVIVDDSDSDEVVSLVPLDRGWVLKELYRLGYGVSLRKGINFAVKTLDAERVIIMDADHPIDYLQQFIDALDYSDIVMGEETTEWASDRTVTKKLCSLVGINVSHPTCGYMGFNRDVLIGYPWSRFNAGWDVSHLEFLYASLQQGHKISEVQFGEQFGERSYSWKRRFVWLWEFMNMVIYMSLK